MWRCPLGSPSSTPRSESAAFALTAAIVRSSAQPETGAFSCEGRHSLRLAAEQNGRLQHRGSLSQGRRAESECRGLLLG